MSPTDEQIPAYKYDTIYLISTFNQKEVNMFSDVTKLGAEKYLDL